jgi:hypothetical protein
MEKQFAVVAVQHMETYWSLLQNIRGSTLRLTRFDDEILGHLHSIFPDFDPAKELDEDAMKSPEGKRMWREFMNVYEKGEKEVKDFNFGTLLRKGPRMGCDKEEEVIFAVRMQWVAIEIARNRAGLNDWIYEEKQQEKEEAKKSGRT